MLTTQATRLTCIAALVLTLAACGDKGASNTQGGASGATNTVILPFLMDRISRIKCSSMAAYRRWLDEAFHDYRTTTNGWHNPEYHLSC